MTIHSPVVIRFGRLGDTVLLQPFLHKLHLRYGTACHLLALGDWPAVLYSAQPEVGGFIPLDSQYGPLWLRPRRVQAALALGAMRHSPFYICEPELRTGTKIRPMLALARVAPENCTFIENTPARDDEHWVDWLLRFADTTPPAFAGLAHAREDVAPAPALNVSAGERRDALAWLHAAGIAERPLVLLQPANKRTMRWNGVRAAVDDDKSWPAERWAALAHAAGSALPQAHVLFCGSSAESDYLQAILKVVPPSPGISAAALPLGRLKGLLAMAHSMVSVDTGPAHLAAALGCPLVVLMGARSPGVWTPRSGSGSAVTVLGGLPLVRRVDEIDVARVLDAWRRLGPREEHRLPATAPAPGNGMAMPA